MAPELMRAAVTADYTSECLQFLRSGFDIEDPDPATVFHCVEKFDAHMKALFVEGYILSKPASGGHDPAEKTACQMVFEEVEFPEPKLAALFYSFLAQKTENSFFASRKSIHSSHLLAAPAQGSTTVIASIT